MSLVILYIFFNTSLQKDLEAESITLYSGTVLFIMYIFCFIIIYEPLFVLRNDCNQRKKARFYQASSHAYA